MAKLEHGGPVYPISVRGVDGITIRDYACIHLRIPETGHAWLDELITTARRDELAGRAMQGYSTSERWIGNTPSEIAQAAYVQTDAMLAAGQKPAKE